jgi:hypothetical protein
MLLAPKAGSTSLGFVLGWVAGVVAVTTVVTVIAATVGLGSSDGGASTTSSWIKIVLGVGLVLLAVRQWRSRPEPGQDEALPKWRLGDVPATWLPLPSEVHPSGAPEARGGCATHRRVCIGGGWSAT